MFRLLIFCLVLVFAPLQQPVVSIEVSAPTVVVGESITYTITSTNAAGIDVSLSEQVIITQSPSNCMIPQPMYHTYCVLDAPGSVAITAQLTGAFCDPLQIDVIVNDQPSVRGPTVGVIGHTCVYLSIIRA